MAERSEYWKNQRAHTAEMMHQERLRTKILTAGSLIIFAEIALIHLAQFLGVL